MKKLFLLFIAVALCSTVMAKGRHQTHGRGGGWNSDQLDPNEDNDAYIEQVGSVFGLLFGNNDAYIDQTDAEDAKAYIYQNGFDNEAYIGQTGEGNVAGGELESCMDLCDPHLWFGMDPGGDDYLRTFDVDDIECICGEWVTEAVTIALPWVGYGIVEDGYDLTAVIIQNGEDNAAGVNLDGAGLNASVVQNGEENVSMVNMVGSDPRHESDVRHLQAGEGNFAYTSLVTQGGDNEALIIQDDAEDNVAIQVAVGEDLKLGIVQDRDLDGGFFGAGCTGDHNVAVQKVIGEDLDAFILQRGDWNEAIELVAGEDNEAGIKQYGFFNDAMIKQGNP